MSGAAYHFLPWVRHGLSTAIAPVDPLGPGTPARVSIPVTVRMGSRSAGSDEQTDDVTMALGLYGPGDVIGLDPREVVRTVPRHLTREAPPHLLAAIEFDRPDLPWLFTPAAADGDRLRPWLVLVVVDKADAEIAYEPGRPLPVLTCRRADLPDLDESWLWAHAQLIAGRDLTDVSAELGAEPAQTVSRLLCPRRLDAASSYLACVVPAFAVGRLAGLGEAVPAEVETRLDPAWDLSEGPATLRLPVYHSWEFSTAATEGDFEDLVDRLELPGSEVMPDPVLMDVSRPGHGLPPVDGATMGLHSALHLPGATPTGWPDSLGTTFAQFQERLRTTLSRGPASAQGVPPPIYGAPQAVGARGDAGRNLDGSVPQWVRTLNLDPRYRSAAAIGAAVVRAHQEELVSAAWRQAGELADANRWLAQKQLAREVTRSVYEKRLKALTPESLDQVIAPVVAPTQAPGTDGAGAFAAGSTTTVDADRGAGELLMELTSAPFRRLVRPGSHLVRRTSPGSATAPTMAGRDAPVATGLVGTGPTLLDRLDPSVTYAAEARSRITTSAAVQTTSAAEPLAPLRVAPTFPQPMYEPLRDLFRDLLLPGLDRIPDNSVMVLGTDPAFIEAYLVGLNDEMSRELLWREFPADLRGTYFRQFWDVSSHVGPDSSEADLERLRDIPPISGWQQPLGRNMRPERGSDLVVLLVKGDLLARFPTAVVFAAPARWSVGGSGSPAAPAVVDDTRAPVFPSLTVEPVPGVRLLGFDLPGGADAAVGDHAPPGDPGWFIVLQEHPTEPRFGLNANRVDALTTWRKLAWSDVRLRGGSGHIDAGGGTPTLSGQPGAADRAVRWARGAADMAYITLQKAYRLEVHAGYWLR